MENFKKITKQQSPARTIAFGFAVLIFIGAALLSLPIAVRGAVQLPRLDALFTATSAVCVTGWSRWTPAIPLRCSARPCWQC